VPVGRLCEGHRDHDSCSVDSLPHIRPVDSPGHFLDEHGGEFLGSQFPVDTEEVDLSHFNLLSSGNHGDWDACDESEELLFLSSSDSKLPVLDISGKRERPLKEGYLIVESEHCVIIFYIVLGQQGVNFFSLFGIVDVNIRPEITCR